MNIVEKCLQNKQIIDDMRMICGIEEGGWYTPEFEFVKGSDKFRGLGTACGGKVFSAKFIAFCKENGVELLGIRITGDGDVDSIHNIDQFIAIIPNNTGLDTFKTARLIERKSGDRLEDPVTVLDNYDIYFYESE